jgi:hypothetical protein
MMQNFQNKLIAIQDPAKEKQNDLSGQMVPNTSMARPNAQEKEEIEKKQKDDINQEPGRIQ